MQMSVRLFSYHFSCLLRVAWWSLCLSVQCFHVLITSCLILIAPHWKQNIPVIVKHSDNSSCDIGTEYLFTLKQELNHFPKNAAWPLKLNRREGWSILLPITSSKLACKLCLFKLVISSYFSDLKEIKRICIFVDLTV